MNPMEEKQQQETAVIEIACEVSETEIEDSVLFLTKRRKKVTMLVQTIILAIMIVVFVYSAITNPSNYHSILLGLICAVIIGVIWMAPIMHARQIARASVNSSGTLNYTIRLTEDAYLIDKNETEESIAYTSDCTLYDVEELLILLAAKSSMIVIPKRAFESEEEKNSTIEFLKQVMGERYESVKPRKSLES